jgi:predicted RNase H-like HicB family nuclease
MNPRVKSSSSAVRPFPVVVQPDILGGFWASCPALEGCYSQGKTIDEALKNIREAIELCIEDLPVANRKTLPMDISVHVVAV